MGIFIKTRALCSACVRCWTGQMTAVQSSYPGVLHPRRRLSLEPPPSRFPVCLNGQHEHHRRLFRDPNPSSDTKTEWHEKGTPLILQTLLALFHHFLLYTSTSPQRYPHRLSRYYLLQPPAQIIRLLLDRPLGQTQQRLLEHRVFRRRFNDQRP